MALGGTGLFGPGQIALDKPEIAAESIEAGLAGRSGGPVLGILAVLRMGGLGANVLWSTYPRGGHVDREYAAGRGRIDILVRWPVADHNGHIDLYGHRFERHLFELKVWYEGRADPLPGALDQLGEYLGRVPCESASVLVFDRRKRTLRKKWAARMRIADEQSVVAGLGVWVWAG